MSNRRPRLLDLFCCAGGAAMGYHRAGFDVVGVDINPQPDYPFEFHQGDALEFVEDRGCEFDAIHASPPCQDHTSLTKGNRARDGWTDDHADLIPDTRRLLDSSGLPYVIENVMTAPVRPDVVLCGLMFNLRVFRHRQFEVGGWSATAPAHPSHRGHRVAGWRHGVRYEGDMFAVYGDGGGKGSISEWQLAMGMDHTASRSALAEAIPPAYTEHLGRQLIVHMGAEVAS